MSIFLSGYRPPAPLPTEDSAAGARAADRSERTEVRLDRALLTMEALWSLLSERLGVTEAELIERIIEIDLQDGVLDGKVRRPPMECGACNRPIPRRFPRCLYCGAAVTPDPFV